MCVCEIVFLPMWDPELEVSIRVWGPIILVGDTNLGSTTLSSRFRVKTYIYGEGNELRLGLGCTNEWKSM